MKIAIEYSCNRHIFIQISKTSAGRGKKSTNQRTITLPASLTETVICVLIVLTYIQDLEIPSAAFFKTLKKIQFCKLL